MLTTYFVNRVIVSHAKRHWLRRVLNDRARLKTKQGYSQGDGAHPSDGEISGHQDHRVLQLVAGVCARQPIPRKLNHMLCSGYLVFKGEGGVLGM